MDFRFEPSLSPDTLLKLYPAINPLSHSPCHHYPFLAFILAGPVLHLYTLGLFFVNLPQCLFYFQTTLCGLVLVRNQLVISPYHGYLYSGSVFSMKTTVPRCMPVWLIPCIAIISGQRFSPVSCIGTPPTEPPCMSFLSFDTNFKPICRIVPALHRSTSPLSPDFSRSVSNTWQVNLCHLYLPVNFNSWPV